MSLRAWLQRGQRALLASLLGVALLPPAQAHLMVAQRGTLNVVGDGAFMVLSLPVTAFVGVDDDHDGQWSPAEFSAHEAAIKAQVQRGVQLLDWGRALPLQGVMLQLSPGDHTAQGTARQVVVLGRFALGDERSRLQLELSLFGTRPDERAQEVTVSRGDQARRMLLTPEHPAGDLFPSAWSTLASHAMEGVTHVLGGLDHLLFLLVALASGWGLRQALLALTCFTLGHAITLAASVIGGLTVPAAVVEPAIALTIVAMALFDRWAQRRQRSGAAALPPGLRYALVFGCALVHGLGLAGALSDLGLDTHHRLWSLAGFNLGVEAAQAGVALFAALVLVGLRRLHGAVAPDLVARLGALMAVSMGLFWFMQRASGMA